jgi:NitT/TauT family transport system substrate-binding protein
MARSDWIGENPEAVRRIGSAMKRSLRWIHTHSAEQVMGAIPDEYKGNDSDLYLRALRDILPVFSTDGLMPKDGPSHMRDFLSASDPQLLQAHFRLEDTYTDAYVTPQ